jgi:hypothetical protein
VEEGNTLAIVSIICGEFLSLNYKVSFCKYVNSLWKKTYKNVVSLSSLWSDEPHLGAKPLEVLLRVREERLSSGMHLIVVRVESGQ